MQNAGIVGAGGAGFPSYAKLAQGADTLVINGAECEPMLYTDYSLMSAYLPLVVEGASIVMQTVGMKRCLIGIKKHNCIKLGLSEGQELAPGITVKQLPNVYPMGDEIALIYETTGRLVQPGQLPITQGVIVYNAETMFNIRNAVVWAVYDAARNKRPLCCADLHRGVEREYQKMGKVIPYSFH